VTVYMLKEKHLQNHPNSHYFDYDTLKFFGERMSEMRVLKDLCKVKDVSGEEHNAYCLSSIQHKAPNGTSKRKYAYFDSITFDHIIV